MVGMYEPYVEVCRLLDETWPGAGVETKSLLVNSGAEAVENAVKIARTATGRPAVIVFDHAFHGRTSLTMAMTAKVVPYKQGFGPFPGEVYRSAAPYPYRGVSSDDAIEALAHSVQAGRRSRQRRLRRARARAGRRRLRRDARGLPAHGSRSLRAARDPLRRRRGAGRRRQDRAGVGDRALRRRARPDRVRQVARGRSAARRRHRRRPS